MSLVQTLKTKLLECRKALARMKRVRDDQATHTPEVEDDEEDEVAAGTEAGDVEDTEDEESEELVAA